MRVARWLSAAIAAGMVTGTSASPLAAQVIRGDTARDIHWTGQVAGGRWLRVRNLSGPIRVTPSDGNDLVVDAHKRWRHGDPAAVRVTIERTGTSDGDVLVCALWGNETSCDEDGYRGHSHHHHDEDDDVEVEFTVRLPKGVNIATSTVNGSVFVQGATGRVDASTVNGGVEAGTTGGPVQASTVNGDVVVHMGTVAEAVNLDYSTVNGAVTVYLPDKVNADIEMSTVNGSFHSDYPLALNGRIEPRHIRATIGSGGPRLRCSTVNGSIDLRKTT
jgi:putative adhesin